MSLPIPDQGLPADPAHNSSDSAMPEVPAPVADHRSDDLLEAESIKYNVARIVRLSSGNFALFSHYRAGTLDLIKVGTIEEIAPHIPGAAECAFTAPAQPRSTAGKIKSIDLADLGL